jgi:hypothetical protein
MYVQHAAAEYKPRAENIAHQMRASLDLHSLIGLFGNRPPISPPTAGPYHANGARVHRIV